MTQTQKVQKIQNLIAVMGVTGAGKSYFIKSVTNNNGVIIGDGLQSCTSEINAVNAEIDNQQVTLVDTPGFDDTNRSDTEILKDIVNFLTVTYQSDTRLKGIIYLHRISDVRMQGSALKNLNMFRKLCGEDCFRNVILVTTRWDCVDGETGRRREHELMDTFWKPMLSRGSSIKRFAIADDGVNMIRQMIPKNDVVLSIQKEIVDENKSFEQTNAALEMNQEINKQIAKFRQECDELQEQIRESHNDKELLRELHEQLQKNSLTIQRYQDEIEEMKKFKPAKQTLFTDYIPIAGKIIRLIDGFIPEREKDRRN